MSAQPAVRLRPMTIADHPAVLALLQETPGMSVREADSHEATARYLARNPGLSFVAETGGQLAGCAMAGHDGRRGYLQHVVVRPAFRRQGVASALVEHCLAALEREGILKTHLDVLRANEAAQAFWQRRGWLLREDTRRFSFICSGSGNA